MKTKTTKPKPSPKQVSTSKLESKIYELVEILILANPSYANLHERQVAVIDKAIDQVIDLLEQFN